MTPAQRAEWKEHQERLYAMAVDNGETWDLSDNDQAACNAGGDAIMALLDKAQERTCGTCQHLRTYPTKRPRCGNAESPAWCAEFVKEGDGCILGWSPREDAPEDAR